MYYDFFDYAFGALLGVMMLVIVGFIGFLVYDSFYLGIKTEPKVVVCRQQQMEPMRLTLTDSVVCVPYATRRDTLAIQEVK